MKKLLVAVLACFMLAAAGAAGYTVDAVLDAILKVESGGHAYSIFDNSTQRSYRLKSRGEAEELAGMLTAMNHNIDMGTYQINSIHLKRGWTVSQLFDVAFNRKAARTIFTEWLDRAIKMFGDTLLAWERAIGAYNSGTIGLKNGNPKYQVKVLHHMGGARAVEVGQFDGSRSSSAAMALMAADDDEDDEDLSSLRKEDIAGQAELADVGALALVLLVCVALIKIGGPVVLRVIWRIVVAVTKGTLKQSRKAAQTMKGQSE